MEFYEFHTLRFYLYAVILLVLYVECQIGYNQVMTLLQTELVKALESMGDRNRFTDAQLAKKLREIGKVDGKNKAIIALTDLMAVVDAVADFGKKYSITITSANDIVIERTESVKEISLENRQRRQRHEKSCMIFTNSDFTKNSSKDTERKHKKAGISRRICRESLDVNGEWE